jgi:hypothetical protein
VIRRKTDKEYPMKTTTIIVASTLALCAYAPLTARAQTETDVSERSPEAAPAATTEAVPLPAIVPATPSAPVVDVIPAPLPEAKGPAIPTEPTGPSTAAAERRYTFWGAEPGRPADESSFALSPTVPIRFASYTWLDTGYMKQQNQQVGSYDKDVNYAQGRFVLGVSYRRDMGPLFAEARAQFVAFDNEFTKSQYEPHTQDAFVRVGGRLWDVQVGRFLAWEPYYRGNGIDRYTAEENGALGGPSMYRLDYALGYKDEAGQGAFHLYPVDWMAFELGAVYGQESSQNNLGVRPVLALRRFGFLLIGGWEYVKQRPQDSSNKVKQNENGFAGRLAYTFAGTTLGVNVSHVNVDAWQIDGEVNGTQTFDKTSMGGYVESEFHNNVVGAGYHYTTSDNKKGESNAHHQSFLSYGYRLPVPGLTISGILGFARAAIEDADAKSSWENDVTSFRVRVRYDMQ